MIESPAFVRINIAQQCLTLSINGIEIMSTRISTAANGAGEQNDSGCTPRGRHYIRAKIGGGCKRNTVFSARRPTGEILTPVLSEQFPGRDWILTRILWLCGMESGKNRLGEVDTMRRYIYIHGTADETQLGKPVSHGCIRMNNDDIIRLFDLVDVGTTVNICED